MGGYKTMGPPLGLLTVAALLPRGWDLRLVDLNARELREEDWQGADLVLISAMHVQSTGFLKLVQEAKSRGKTVVAGGPHPTVFAEEALGQGCDFVVRGEGEEALPLLLEALATGAPRIIESPGKPDMTASPIPRFDLLPLQDYRIQSIQTSRGCPYNCEFCDVVSLFGRKPRYKTPPQVLAELDAIYRLGFRGTVFICDDNFFGSRWHARAILEALIPWQQRRGRPFNFFTQASLNLGEDQEMLDLMVQARFDRVFAGIESPDEQVLDFHRKYHNLRHPLVESVQKLNRHGIEVVGSFILGFDGEKRGAGQRICAFADQTALPVAMINVLQALPHTDLWRRLHREGRLRPDAPLIADGTIPVLNFEPDRPEAEILQEYAEVWDYLYEPSRHLDRTYRYYLNMPPDHRDKGGAPGPIPGTEAVPEPKKTWRRKFTGLKALTQVLWWLGVRGQARRRFWTQLLGMWRRNPTRLRMYLRSCARMLDLCDLRVIIREKVGALLQEQRHSTPAASGRTEAADLRQKVL